MLERLFQIDFSQKRGKIKPLGSIGGPLFSPDLSVDAGEVYRELSVPIVRVAEVEHPYGAGRFLDIHNLFPDFALDERFPESYNFAPTDRYLLAIKETGASIFLRLGESLDPYELRTYIAPPKDPLKYARVLEKIIAHYNTGWGGGYKLGIKYVELWTSPDRKSGFSGTTDEYVELYKVVSRHLKAKFPKLKIGGYSSGGFYSLNHYGTSDEVKGYVPFLERFLSAVTKKGDTAPLDFFSWELSADTPESVTLHSRYASSYLMQYGLKRTESILSSFSVSSDDPALERDYPSRLAASLIVAAKSDISMAFFDTLDPRSMKNGIYSLDDRRTPHKYAAYEVLRAFGLLYRLGTMIETTDDFRREVYSIGAVGSDGGAVLLVTRDYAGLINISLKGASFATYSVLGVIGGGKRGVGHSNRQDDIPLTKDYIKLRVGRGEVYLITFK